MENKINPADVPKKKLYTGEEIPSVGLGTFGSDKYTPQQVSDAVYGAIKSGYRLIDCASVYQNEDKIGEVLQRVFAETDINREELFITSKVWNDMHREVMRSCEKSLKDLKLDCIDLYFVHWPFPNYHAPGCDGDSRNPDSKPFSVDEFMDTWRQCEELVDKGMVRYIGMSNMTIPKLEAVLPLCRIKPAALEMECHPGFQRIRAKAWDTAYRILPDWLPVQAGERQDKRGCCGYPDGRNRGDCRGTSGTSGVSLPKMGGTERADTDSLFGKRAPVHKQLKMRDGRSPDSGRNGKNRECG